MQGWEPREFHRGYDAEGNRVPLNSADVWTLVVEREPEFSDDDRNRLLGLGFFKNTVGPCGYSHEFVTNDPDVVVMPHDTTCLFCAGLTHFERVRGKQEELAQKDRPATAKRPSDGRSTHMRILTPAEAEQAKQKKATGPDSTGRQPGSPLRPRRKGK